VLQLLSNIADITNVDAVLKILRGYYCSVRFVVRREGMDGRGTIQVAEDRWPLALKMEDILAEDEAVEDVLIEDLDDALCEEDEDGSWVGNEGFRALLLELAPYLATPLRIFFASARGFWEDGLDEWTVQPQTKEVFIDSIPPREKDIDSLVDSSPPNETGIEICVDECPPPFSRTLS
jgi:hypothetical protein